MWSRKWKSYSSNDTTEGLISALEYPLKPLIVQINITSIQNNFSLFPSIDDYFLLAWFWKLKSMIYFHLLKLVVDSFSLEYHHDRSSLEIAQMISLLNLIHVISLFLYPPMTLEKKMFSDVFRGYRKKPAAWNGLLKSENLSLFLLK